MQVLVTSPPVRIARAVALIATVALLLVPHIAEASCGDYLKGPGHYLPDHHTMPLSKWEPGPLSFLIGVKHSARINPFQSAPKHRRCEGPACSNHSLPTPADSPKPDAPVERWAHLACVCKLDAMVITSPLLQPMSKVYTDLRALEIFRPPR